MASLTSPIPQEGSGLSVYSSVDLQNTGVSVKASQGNLFGYYIYNAASSARYVKIYDKATAATSSDTPLVRLAIPATSGANLLSDVGVHFSLGLSVRACTGVGDSDNTAPTTNDVVANFFYK